MKLSSALYKTIAKDNINRYLRNPIKTFFAAVALMATAVYFPILVMPMLYIALASFVANVFFNMGNNAGALAIIKAEKQAAQMEAAENLTLLRNSGAQNVQLQSRLSEKNLDTTKHFQTIIESRDRENTELQQKLRQLEASMPERVAAATAPLHTEISKLQAKLSQEEWRLGLEKGRIGAQENGTILALQDRERQLIHEVGALKEKLHVYETAPTGKVSPASQSLGQLHQRLDNISPTLPTTNTQGSDNEEEIQDMEALRKQMKIQTTAILTRLTGTSSNGVFSNSKPPSPVDGVKPVQSGRTTPNGTST
jgi:hypothetical protein